MLPGATLEYRVEYENEGEGSAFGVYFTDTLDTDLDDSTLQIGPVMSTLDGSVIAPAGSYNPAIRTITWLVGQVGPGEGGYTDFSVNVPADAEIGTEIINFATVYFPSVPEATRTNGIVSIVSLNQPPEIGAITAPIGPVSLGTAIDISADFTDPDTADSHTALWEWGDGTSLDGTVTETDGSGSVDDSYTYTAAGIYTITLTLTDAEGEADESVFQYVVVYDPEGGFVTGGGWIDSPGGAYAADPALTGKANFGFVSKYQSGASVPAGQTLFQFKVADLNFHSTSYQWLVIGGPQAKFKGSGTINGDGDYGFMLTAVDGQRNGGGEIDRFRMKIWDKTTDEIVYDNQMGADDGAEPTTAIGGGSIVIHGED